MTNELDIGDDLDIRKIDRRTMCGGAWCRGTVAGCRFEALVFAGHAECAEWEIDQSRISKLWVQRLADKKTVYSWDRGLDIAAADTTAQAIVDFLAAGLADFVYAE